MGTTRVLVWNIVMECPKDDAGNVAAINGRVREILAAFEKSKR